MRMIRRMVIWIGVFGIFSAYSLPVSAKGLSRSFFSISPSNTRQSEVVELRPEASVGKPVVGSDGTQNVYIVVRDQDLRPVEGAAVTLVAQFFGETRTLLMPSTDARGISMLNLIYDGELPGSEILLEFFVSSGSLLTTTRDSFRIWW